MLPKVLFFYINVSDLPWMIHQKQAKTVEMQSQPLHGQSMLVHRPKVYLNAIAILKHIKLPVFTTATWPATNCNTRNSPSYIDSVSGKLEKRNTLLVNTEHHVPKIKMRPSAHSGSCTSCSITPNCIAIISTKHIELVTTSFPQMYPIYLLSAEVEYLITRTSYHPMNGGHLSRWLHFWGQK